MSEEMTYPADIDQTSVAPSVSDVDTAYEVEGKSFGIRALAYIIDMVLIYATTYAVAFIVGVLIGTLFLVMGRELVFSDQSTQCMDLFIGVILVLSYFTLFEGLYGASPSKLIAGMRVVKDDGQPCTVRTALHRGLWRYIDAIIFGAVAYSNMSAPLQQRLGDKKARTLVVGKNEPLIQDAREWPWFIVALLAFLLFRAIGVAIVLATLVT